MANELVLTQEEKELIEKRRLREARKLKKEEQLVADVLKKLPTLKGFLRILGIPESKEVKRDIKSHLRDLHVGSDGNLEFKNGCYVREPEEGIIPVMSVLFKSIERVCGKKVPYNCQMDILMIKDRVVTFSIETSDNGSGFFHFSTLPVLDGNVLNSVYCNLSRCDERTFISLFNLDKNEIKTRLMHSLEWCGSEVYKYCENNITRLQQELANAVESRDNAKHRFGSYYKPLKEKGE